MPTVTLSDERWQKILPFLRSYPHAYVSREHDCRKFLEAVLWIPRSGAQWRLLLAEYGDWDTVYKRFSRWSRQGVFEQLHQSFVGDADLEHLLIDSTILDPKTVIKYGHGRENLEQHAVNFLQYEDEK